MCICRYPVDVRCCSPHPFAAITLSPPSSSIRLWVCCAGCSPPNIGATKSTGIPFDLNAGTKSRTRKSLLSPFNLFRFAVYSLFHQMSYHATRTKDEMGLLKCCQVIKMSFRLNGVSLEADNFTIPSLNLIAN